MTEKGEIRHVAVSVVKLNMLVPDTGFGVDGWWTWSEPSNGHGGLCGILLVPGA